MFFFIVFVLLFRRDFNAIIDNSHTRVGMKYAVSYIGTILLSKLVTKFNQSLTICTTYYINGWRLEFNVIL